MARSARLINASASDSPVAIAIPMLAPMLTFSPASRIGRDSASAIRPQMVVTTDGTKAYIVSNLPTVLVYNVTTGATSTIPLANGA